MENSSWPPEDLLSLPGLHERPQLSPALPVLVNPHWLFPWTLLTYGDYPVSITIPFEGSWAPAVGWPLWWDCWPQALTFPPLTPTRGLGLFTQEAPYCFSVFGSQSFMLPYSPFSSVKNQQLALISWHVHFPLLGGCMPQSHLAFWWNGDCTWQWLEGIPALLVLGIPVLSLSLWNRTTALIWAVKPV